MAFGSAPKEGIVSETGNWNVASNYSKFKIMKPLFAADYYEEVALFGNDSLIEDIASFGIPNGQVRYRALVRLIETLLLVINNTRFAMKVPGTKEQLVKHYNDLRKLRLKTSELVASSYDPESKRDILEIKNYTIFDNFISLVSHIKAEINNPLNKNHLIFTDKEEFDPKKYKENLKQRMIEQG